MLNDQRIKLSKYKQIVTIIIGMLVAGISPSIASSLNADAVLNKMTLEQRHSYVSGVIEGLAYSRWLKDKPSDVGMQCIYKWYYSGKTENLKKIYAWFERHPDKPVGALLYVLIKKECGV